MCKVTLFYVIRYYIQIHVIFLNVKVVMKSILEKKMVAEPGFEPGL